MSDVNVSKASLTPQHLIVEYKGSEGLADTFLPSLKRGGLKIAGVNHLQVMRYVYTIVQMEDVYFEGRRLTDMPGIRETFLEWITPGQQIVSVPNGGLSVTLSYVGKKNIVQAQSGKRTFATMQFPFLKLSGEDPAPTRILCDNANVPFVQLGDGPPTAAAYYNSASRRFEIIPSPDRRTLLQNFTRRFANQTALAG